MTDAKSPRSSPPSPERRSTPVSAIHIPRSHSRASRPFVLMNMAMTADGKIASVNRSISSFGSKRDLGHLYELRATADAVMNGARTIEANNVTMGVGGTRFAALRRRRGLSNYALRVIVSGSGTIDPEAVIFKRRFSPIVILTTQCAARARLRLLEKLAGHVWICGRNKINLHSALQRLRRDWNVRRLVCEGGAELNDALLREGLVDEVRVTVCPMIFGGRRAPTLAEGVGTPNLASASRFRIHSMNRIHDELFLVLRAERITK